MTGRLEPRRPVDEEGRVVDLMFLAEFREKHRGNRGGSRRIESNIEQAVRCGIDGSVQPVALVAELNHGFVDRNVIRVRTDGGL